MKYDFISIKKSKESWLKTGSLIPPALSSMLLKRDAEMHRVSFPLLGFLSIPARWLNFRNLLPMVVWIAFPLLFFSSLVMGSSSEAILVVLRPENYSHSLRRHHYRVIRKMSYGVVQSIKTLCNNVQLTTYDSSIRISWSTLMIVACVIVHILLRGPPILYAA